MSAQFSEDNNIGGAQRIQLAPAYAFSSLSPGVVFRAGYSWDDMVFLPENAQLTDESAEGDNGMQYTYNLVFAFNKKDADKIAALRKYLGTVAVALVTDSNGFQQIIGNQQTPITIKQNTDSGKQYTNMNNLLYTGVVVQDREALLYDPNYVPPVIPPIITNGIFNASLTENLIPWVDADVEIDDNGASVLELFANGDHGSISMIPGHAFIIKAISRSGGHTAVDPQISLRVVKNGVQVFFDQQPATVGRVISFPGTVEDSAVYTVTVAGADVG
ncbi:hypothetical protein [Mucilaginibacter sp.]|uniref:hypothetical protein n=1 Tax=Mucilaginibacter sp. TaxID=1882438 RepID=UPI00262B4CD6|nr:hypothetical protein [Mucilaginibacter sp.]MDB4919835.1 hypothetical protein [Mucilaginibacter sp.]